MIFLTVVRSNRSDLLSHEYIVGDPKADKGNGYKADDMGKHDINALRKAQWPLKSL